MSTLVEMFYREYCRARLAEMRKQLLIPVASDDILQTFWEDGERFRPRQSKRRLANERASNHQVAQARNRIVWSDTPLGTPPARSSGASHRPMCEHAGRSNRCTIELTPRSD